MSRHGFRDSNRACPSCESRLEAQPLVDFMSEYRCPDCGWSKVFDPRMGATAASELEWYEE